MVSDKMKTALSIANGFAEKRQVELIREGVRKKYPNPSDEIAVLRKAVALLFEVVSSLHDGEIQNDEFYEYHTKVESVKAEVKEAFEVEN